MKSINLIFIMLFVFSLLTSSGIVFAQSSDFVATGIFLEVDHSGDFVFGVAPLLKGGKVSGDDIQEFLNAPLEQQIFAIVAAIAIIIFVIWYTTIGKHMNLFLRIGIIIALLLLIFVPLYLLGNILFLVVAAIVTLIVLIVTWYQEHGRHMTMSRLIGIVIGVCLLLVLMIGVPGYFYSTTSEDINVTVTSKSPNLEIVDYKAFRNTFSGQSEVQFQGYVKNNGKTSAEFVQVNVTGYDAAGNVVANDTVYVDDQNLLAGSTSPFGELSSYTSGKLEDPQKMIVSVKLEVFTNFKI